MTLAYHPYAEIFPLIEGKDFEEFCAGIKDAGRLHDKIVLHEKMILDGRNRQRACDATGIVAHYRVFDPKTEGDPLAFVIAKNLHRRNLNDDQRRVVAAKLVNMPPWRPSGEVSQNATLISIPTAARMTNSDIAGVNRAREVVSHATPAILAAVEHGKLSVASAAKARHLGAPEQQRVAELAEAGRANVVRTVIKQGARAAREKTTGLAMPEGQFGVILEDFEWDYETWSDAGRDRHAENHYETATDAHSPEEIVARTAARFACAADDCVLFMYAPGPHLWIALQVMALRGFAYKSNAVWDKGRIITGRWFRFRHEHLLVGTRGNVPCPADGTQWDSLINEISSGEHSEKPEDSIHRMIEQYFPTWRKIELNRRGAPRSGWSCWGNEAELAPIDPIIVAHEARKIFPVGHTVSMTNPTIENVQMSVATCSCGMAWSWRWDDPDRHDACDIAIERHWQKFDGFAQKVDGRGRPVMAGYGCVKGDGCSCQVVDAEHSLEVALAKRSRCGNWRREFTALQRAFIDPNGMGHLPNRVVAAAFVLDDEWDEAWRQGSQWTPAQAAAIQAAHSADDREAKPTATVSHESEKLSTPQSTVADDWNCSRGSGCACAEDTRGECPFWRLAANEEAA
jgi:N6-adenosine-specific RNA methylase IME4